MLPFDLMDHGTPPRPLWRPLHVPLNIGHRGAAADAPENTLAAFELALRQGADGIEFDVHLSADGVPVVIHDARLDRTTSGTGRVGDHGLRALRRLDAGSWFNRRYPARARARYVGRKIPLLAEVLGWVHDRKCLAFVEIKKGRKPYPNIEASVVEEIHRAGVASLARVISFDLPTLRRLRQMDPYVPLGIDFTRPLLAVTRARLIKAGTVLPHWAFASRRFVKRAHDAGLNVVVWDLDEPRWMRRKIADGVDGIITRIPGRLAEIVRRQLPALRGHGAFNPYFHFLNSTCESSDRRRCLCVFERMEDAPEGQTLGRDTSWRPLVSSPGTSDSN